MENLKFSTGEQTVAWRRKYLYFHNLIIDFRTVSVRTPPPPFLIVPVIYLGFLTNFPGGAFGRKRTHNQNLDMEIILLVVFFFFYCVFSPLNLHGVQTFPAEKYQVMDHRKFQRCCRRADKTSQFKTHFRSPISIKHVQSRSFFSLTHRY